MNGTISKIGSVMVAVTVFLFALFLIVGTTYMQCFVCFFLPIGFILMTSGLHSECVPDRKVAGDAGMIFSAVYCTFIMIVYFTQITTISTDSITEGAAQLIDFRRHGLIFNFDILGYGMMALSTFFTGLSMEPSCSSDKWLKGLMIIHGAFFPGCVFMPMTGMFTHMSSDGSGSAGSLALIVWCIYFLPIGVLSYMHFDNMKKHAEA